MTVWSSCEIDYSFLRLTTHGLLMTASRSMRSCGFLLSRALMSYLASLETPSQAGPENERESFFIFRKV
jgi:hypothetical protein